jgi:hypothetical protein
MKQFLKNLWQAIVETRMAAAEARLKHVGK